MPSHHHQGGLEGRERSWAEAWKAAAGEPFAVISDVHANLEALNAVLADVERRELKSVFCLGDLVGYGPDPQACIERVRAWGIPSLMGNHDAYLSSRTLPTYLHPDAAVTLGYARRCLSEQEVAYLAGLPVEFVADDVAFVHASFPHPRLWNYVTDAAEAGAHLRSQPATLSFFGHTHRPGGFVDERGRITRLPPAGTRSLAEGRPVCINPGAVGQPRDGDPRASYASFDPRTRSVRFHRVDYDYEQTADKIAKAGLPVRIGERLRWGH